jgi:hypothetical protein
MDGREIGITNIDSAIDCIPIIIENIKISIIAEGTSYLLKERKFLTN